MLAGQRDIDLALKKQRLQLQSAALRERAAAHGARLAPVFAGFDRLQAGTAWLRAHPQVLVAAAVALLVARPRNAVRWLRRGLFAWQAWKRLRRLVHG
jgi:hypothetical protein